MYGIKIKLAFKATLFRINGVINSNNLEIAPAKVRFVR